MFEPKKCPGDCIYMIQANGCEHLCNYIFQAHEMRGCDPGPDCKRYVGSEAKRNKLRKPSWDAGRGRQMWEQGCKDRQIAETLGVKVGTVGNYRRRVWEKD